MELTDSNIQGAVDCPGIIWEVGGGGAWGREAFQYTFRHKALWEPEVLGALEIMKISALEVFHSLASSLR